MNDTFKIAFRAMFVAAMTLLAGSTATAQVHVKGNVFGGGNLAEVGGSVTVNMIAGTVDNDVYGGGALANTNTSNTPGATTYTTTVNLKGGTIEGNAYGGGLGRKAKAAVDGQPAQGTEGDEGYVPAVPAQAAVTAVEALVYGNVTLKLNEGVDPAAKGCVVKGKLFGCNNVNGTPKGNVEVHVYATQSATTDKIQTKARNKTASPITGAYDVVAVYGGGNEAAYVPESPYNGTTGSKSQVIIEGCNYTSIETVYGGGNAAAVPESNVQVLGAYEIGYVYGGGNGKDNLSDGTANPGADIGQYNNNGTLVTYGTGIPSTTLTAGYIHEAYGGSNQKGVIKGSINLVTNPIESGATGYCCDLALEKVVGAGKYADIEGDVILVMGCMPESKTAEVFGGADEANVKGNVELTITSGTFGKVFGGNNLGGAILGHIILNIEETGCHPIKIDELYLGGNQAAYSIYGYYDSGTTNAVGKPVYLPRTSESDEHPAVTNPATDANHSFPYAQPVLNVISCTYIGKVFGGGLGVPATMYANPTVSINMIPGTFASSIPSTTDNPNKLGEIGTVYGGGNAADVVGDPTVNIGTAATVDLVSTSTTGNTVLGAYITGNVFGGGMGKDDTFTCEKAMVGKDGDGINNPDGGTTVNIGNGIVMGNVYGGGEIGRVEKNTVVTIGLESGTGTPVIKGDVFGGGKGLETHGYAALVRGNPTVTIQGKAKIGHNVYGGGEIASVARYKVPKTPEEVAAAIAEGYDAVLDMPYVLADPDHPSGKCKVIVKGDAEIGPDNMQMTKADGPDDMGHVFGAGKGILPKEYSYTAEDDANMPKRMINENGENKWQYFHSQEDYITFIQTLALSSYTEVSIEGNAFVKGSVYGGSENGLVQFDTKVYIKNGQIGNGDGVNGRYSDSDWSSESLAECASWKYGIEEGEGDNKKTIYAPYDPYANATGDLDQYSSGKSTAGGRRVASDGHTFYGNVFGGGSGSVPYFDTTEGISKYLPSAGLVRGDSYVEICGGHILTNVYGGNEATNVLGTAHVTMTGGSIGVPRTAQQIKDHPVTCYLFGAGKGDQRIYFNKETNVKDAIVKVEGGRIYGSVFGGGEDGHVLRNTSVTIGKTDGAGPTIGTVGSTYVDGNVFGGGRGFGGEALTSGNVGGTVGLTINGGEMLGSVYGGGRLASVGYGLYLVDEVVGGVKPYGVMRPDNVDDKGNTVDNFKRGYITVTINGGTIGKEFADDAEGEHSGNVFGGSMGRLTKLDGSSFDDPKHWTLLATAKSTTVNINGGIIKRSVYGGGEMGTVTTDAIVNVSGGTIGTSGKGGAEFGNVYGGGKGYVDDAGTYATAGIIQGNTKVTINSGTNGEPKIYHNIYGGGAYGSVGTITYGNATYIPNQTAAVSNMPTAWERAAEGTTQVNTGTAEVYVYGGTIGTNGNENGMVFGSSRGDVGTPVNGIDPNNRLAWVYNTKVVIGSEGKSPIVYGSVYGSGENGHVFENTQVDIHSGTMGVTTDDSFGGPNYRLRGNVYGGGCGEDTYPGTTDTKKENFNPLAGIVLGSTNVTIDGGQVVHNVYGAGALGSATNTSVTIAGNAVIGVSGKDGGNVFGAARGKEGITIVGSNLANSIETAVNINGGQIWGSVYGGGETGNVKQDVNVSMTGGAVAKDVYGGGALAHTQTANWDLTTSTWAEGKTSASSTTIVSLLGGTINGDAYGGGLGRKEYGSAGQDGYVSPIEAMVYGDVQVELNNNNNGGTANGTVRGCAVNRVFGCNNLNGTPKGKVQVYVYATQKSGGENLADKATLNSGSYDVQAVYGGGNLAKYEPVDALLEYNETNKATVDAARPEVYIDGCLLTSIKQVYGGGNAAPVPATYVEINSAYEIDEAFGGGNGKDGYSLKEGNEPVYYENPGANVGYYTYADYPKTSGQGTGTEADPYKAVQDPRYDETDPEEIGTRQARLNATDIQYGSGVATLVVTGGTIHSSYGGSNLRGNVRVRLSSRYSAMNDECPMAVGTSYGGGNKAFSDGSVDMVADCAKGVTEMFGGSKNADFDGDINMLITNGSSLQRVFGGNNTSGAVNGSITITIKEGGCEPIRIGELYAGGFLAPYSVYGYKKDTNGNYLTENVSYVDADGNQQTQEQRIPLTAEDVDENFVPKANPRINVISATYIGNIFGGGYQAKLVGDPHINVNMEPGRILASYHPEVGDKTDYSGQTYTVESIEESSGDGILSTGTIGNIYGGGNLADIVGDTYVEIGTGKWVKLDADGNEVEETLTRNAANIKGNVFGGGKGKDDTFQCEKGMVGVNGDGIDHPDGGTYITIGNGTVGTLDGNGKLVEGTGNVYGGGEIGRVEKNTMVTIGLAAADVPEGLTSSPVIEGSVFGGGKGKETHGYAALVRGNPTVIIQGNAKVGHNVYGGGEIASVARYDLSGGVPVALAQVKPGQHSGYCTVIVKDNAEIGPDGMKMYHSDITDGSDKPDDWGHVFGAGKGFLPDNYSYDDNENRPKRMMAYDSEKYNESNREYWEYSDTEHQNVWEYFPNRDKYIEFIQTQALATHTDVTIEGNAFVKGSVYGGSENGLVQYDTDVKITGNCQIGEGEGATGRYTDSDWASESLAGCAHWDFDESSGAPYDPYAKYLNPADGKYYYDAGFTEYAEGGSNIAKDGHTYYGNVFGGGSGSVPYFDTTEGRSVYLNSAGTVKGNTKVTISGGHILTSVYGGCESTNVLGTSTVTMTAGTIGVPRTVEQIQAHPVICNLFGAGKGDQRVFFNKDTNVENAVVNVSGTAKIYGSVFGGGEDGHVLRNSKVTIGDGAVIGAFGYSGYDGNVFGGGRGFGGDALTAGNVSGDVEVNINGGSVLGSVYGGGRLASVGYGLYKTTEAGYGEMKDDGIDDAGNSVNGFTRGHVKVNITDGTIGNDTESTLTHTKGGNVFGGSMGRLTLLNGTTNPIWPKLARVKAAEVNIKGGTVKANVYGGGELGTVHTTSKVTVNKGTVNGSVFGGGYGSNDNVTKTEMDGVTYSAVQIAGRVDGTTTVEMNDGQVMKNLYGGGEMASVGVFTASDDMRTFTWGDPYNGTGVCNVTVAGGKIGTTAGSSSAGHVFGAGKGLEDTFWCEKGIVYSTNVNINKGTVNGNVYGGGEVGRVETDAIVKVEGTADIKGNVFGAGAGKETHGYSALVRGNTTVTVQGSAAVGKSVYGGGEIASVGKYGLDNKNMPSILMGGGYCYVTVQGNATVGADVFGAGEGVKSHFNNTDEDLSKRSRRMTLKSDWVSREGADRFDWDYLTESNYPTYLETLALATHPEVTIDGSASIGQSVYGGGELGLTKGSVIVNIKGGTITEDVYGGGSLANTNTTSTVGHTDADGNVTTETVHPTTTVNLLGGTVTRNVYGGGLGQKEVKTGETVTTPGIEAIVYGDVNVNLNGTTTITTDDATGNKTYTPSPNDPTKKGCVVKGNIFGANNVNGTPLGHVLVYVHGTQNENTDNINTKVGEYDVLGVYGGGNQSDYVPTDTKQSTEVIIEGCELTSIDEVYGGGYGAATPATSVLVKGTKIINNVYGGGYGASTDTYRNPGANVGYRSDKGLYEKGTGKAIVQLMAGTVNNVYGGSNTLGDIRGGSSVTNVTNDGSDGCCEKLTVGEIYGGGKQADMYGGAEIILGCMPNDWIGAIYAGAENADIGGDVGLTLTSGKFERVFGGNNKGGEIDGYIEVNIEENPDCGTPIIIGELYGGGNMAPYAVPAKYTENNPDYLSPRVNVRAFTSIGNIYGGGLGANATVTGNPLVNINEVAGGKAYAGETRTLGDGTKVTLYERKANGKMGVIGNVFGGGNAAPVIGNTNVMIGTEAEQEMESLKTKDAAGTVHEVEKDVLGADIQGNVYGAGNNAEVTGHTNVVIGKKAE